MMKRRTFLFGLLLSISGFSGLPAHAAGKAEMLVYPGTGKAQIPQAEFDRGFKALTTSLKSELRLKTKLVRRIPRLYEALGGEKAPEFMFGPPQAAATYINAGYIPLVRVAKKASGMIVSAKSLDDVTRVGYPGEESWLGIVGRYSVNQIRKTDLPHEYFNTQDDVVLALKSGIVDAGSLRANTFEKLRESNPEFTAIIKLPGTADFTVVANPETTTEKEREIIRQAFINMLPEVKTALTPVMHVPVDSFVAADKEDYDILQRIVKAENKLGGNK